MKTKPSRCVVLVGMPGAGKSTVGPILARLLGMPFLDTDLMVAGAVGMPAPDAFRIIGEPAFRAEESRALAAALSGEPSVVATGGGVVLSEANRAIMSAHLVVEVWAPVEAIAARIGAGAGRPLLERSGNLAEALDEMAESRWILYNSVADVKIDTLRGSPETCCADILPLVIERVVPRPQQGSPCEVTLVVDHFSFCGEWSGFAPGVTLSGPEGTVSRAVSWLVWKAMGLIPCSGHVIFSPSEGSQAYQFLGCSSPADPLATPAGIIGGLVERMAVSFPSVLVQR